MNIHIEWEFPTSVNAPICSCGRPFYPDCDASRYSINEAHFLHVIEVFKISLEDGIAIET